MLSARFKVIAPSEPDAICRFTYVQQVAPFRRVELRNPIAKPYAWAENLPHRELLAGFIRLHVLHHAVRGPAIRSWIIEELGRHSYRLSPGTDYPLLRAMERKGLSGFQEQAGIPW